MDINNQKGLGMKNINKNKVTILALHLGTGGVEKYLSSLCKMLENNYEIELISTYKMSDKPAFDFSEKIKIRYLINDYPHKEELKSSIKNIRVLNIIKYLYKNVKILLLKYARNIKAIKKIDSKYVITTRIFHNNMVNKYLTSNEYVKIATEHNYPTDEYKQNLLKSITNFNYLVVVSKDLKNIYSKELKNKCIYIPNVIDSMPIIDRKKEKDTLISIGRLSKEKGYSDLIDVINILKDRNKNIKLYLIGDGSERNELEKKINDLKLSKNIKLLGFLNSKQCSEYLSKSQVYVMSSLSESFGLVLIEAMSHKLPCIAFDSASGARELLSNNKGILISNRDKEKMANDIEILLKDSKKYNKYSIAGYESCKKYLLDNVKKEWIKLMKSR